MEESGEIKTMGYSVVIETVGETGATKAVSGSDAI